VTGSRRRAWLAGLAAALLACGALACGDGYGGDGDDRDGNDRDGGDGGYDQGAPAPGDGTTTSMETGGIEVAAPEGWRAVPLPRLGFGVAIPDAWEAAVLREDVLSDLASAAPVVPGFLDAAHAAAESGAVLYAAGVDTEDRVTDLKVRAAPGTGVTDAAGLEAYARQLAADEGLADPEVAVVDGAARPTVEIRYRTTAERPAGETGTGGGSGAAGRSEGAGEGAGEDGGTVEVTVRGTERLVLSPRGVVYSLIVTSEDDPAHDALAGDLFATLTFPPG
jgi:hypothetical protein